MAIKCQSQNYPKLPRPDLRVRRQSSKTLSRMCWSRSLPRTAFNVSHVASLKYTEASYCLDNARGPADAHDAVRDPD